MIFLQRAYANEWEMLKWLQKTALKNDDRRLFLPVCIIIHSKHQELSADHFHGQRCPRSEKNIQQWECFLTFVAFRTGKMHLDD